MTKKKLLITGIALLCSILSFGQNFSQDNILSYIEQFKNYAMKEQNRSGVPAAITLAQGILESGAGTSELCSNANNHFGIKCKSTWLGQTYTYTDDRPDECFRKYDNAIQSYSDHSDFLKNNKRYARLFEYEITDYKKWAHGLKSCGYATNPKYAHKLIEYVEKYNLDQYTSLALNNTPDNNRENILLASVNPAPILQESGYANNSSSKDDDKKEYYILTTKNGLKGFYAPKGDLLLDFALKNKIRYGKLLSVNDLPDEPLTEDLFIYTEKKLKRGLQPSFEVKRGMSLQYISQETGVEIDQIRLLNHLKQGEEPAPGAVLMLQEQNNQQINTIASSNKNQPDQQTQKEAKKNAESEYIYLDKDKLKETINQDKKAETQHQSEKEEVTKKEQATVVKENKSKVTQQQAAKKPTKEMTETEKLRSMMDGIIYGDDDKNLENENEETIEESSPTSSVTNPDLPNNSEVSKSDEAISYQQDDDNLSPTEKLRKHMATVKTQPQDRVVVPIPEETQETVTVVEKQKTITTPAKIKYYIVKKGDTAFGISKKFGITLQQLRDWNQLPKSMSVPVGKKLRVGP